MVAKLRFAVAEAVGGDRPGARHIPIRLRSANEIRYRLFQEFLHVFPGNILDQQIVTLIVVGIGAHHGFSFRLFDFEFANGERTDFYAMRRRTQGL